MKVLSLETTLRHLQTRGLIAGVAGILVCICGALFQARQFYISYLFAYLFWVGLALGSFGFLMTHHLSGGRWGFPVRRIYEAAIMTLPVMTLCFVPLCFGTRYLYSWMDPQAVAADTAMLHRSGYMTSSGFVIRGFAFLLTWSIAAVIFQRYSLSQETTTDAAPTKALRTLSGPLIVFYPLTATIAFVDWVLSLEPHWSSTMFLVLIVIGQMLSGLALSIVLLAWLRRYPPFSETVKPVHFHHLGMLLFAFIMLWTYMAFSQFLIMYSGNLPREIDWYLHRIAGGWKGVLWFIFLFHFLVPFALLLSRPLKMQPRILGPIAFTVLFAHLVETYWLVVPTFFPRGIHLHWLDLAAPLGLGGIWFYFFSLHFRRHPVLVMNDPRQNEHVA